MNCDKKHIYVYKGDDTNWNNEQFLTINVTSGSPTIDLSTMTAVFKLGNFENTYPLAEGSFSVELTSEITRQFAYGFMYGSVKILDSQERVRTATTQIPFYITSDPIGLQNQDIVIDIPGATIDITVGGTVSYNNLSDKPKINGVTVEGDKLANDYGIATVAGLAQKVSKSGDTMTGNLTMASGTSIVFPYSTIKENQAGNPIIGDGNGNGMVILSNGHGAAFFTNNGSSYTEVVSQKDVKSTYSASGKDPVNGQAVTSAISGKQDTITGAATSITQHNLTANRAVISDNNGKVAVSNVTSTELGYVSGVTGAIQTQITNEVNARTNADIDLQGQIDAISAASDVTDIVGTYAELQAYDTQHLKDNDIIKVLEDSTHNNASSYYRWSTHTETFTYIGSEGPYYTKSEADAEFLSQTSAASTYLTQAIAATTYETQSAASTALALKASNADGTTIVDSGSAISTVAVKEQRNSDAIKQWVGTKEQYDAILSKDVNTLYVITDDEDSSALTVDSSLSSTSENPVQNKVIYNALAGKQDTLPAGTTGQYLQKTANGVAWAAVSALPSQTGNSGKFLTTDGSLASWADAWNTNNLRFKKVVYYTNFTNSNYLQANSKWNFHDANSWEIVLHFKTPSSMSAQWIGLLTAHADGEGEAGFNLSLNYGKIALAAHSNDYSSATGNWWMTDQQITNTLSTSTEYWYKLGFSGTEYYSVLATDRNFTHNTQNWDMTSSYKLDNNQNYARFGAYIVSGMNALGTGCIYIRDCYLKADDEYAFDGADATQYSVQGAPISDSYVRQQVYLDNEWLDIK